MLRNQNARKFTPPCNAHTRSDSVGVRPPDKQVAKLVCGHIFIEVWSLVMSLTKRNITRNSNEMEVLYEHHQATLLCVGMGSLVLGIPLAWNVLWHLKARLIYH